MWFLMSLVFSVLLGWSLAFIVSESKEYIRLEQQQTCHLHLYFKKWAVSDRSWPYKCKWISAIFNASVNLFEKSIYAKSLTVWISWKLSRYKNLTWQTNIYLLSYLNVPNVHEYSMYRDLHMMDFCPTQLKLK